MSRSIADLEEGTRRRAGWLLEWCEDQGIHLIITSTLRTLEEQARLYARGRSDKNGNLLPEKSWRRSATVTDARPGYSWHNFGRAFDICFLVNKRASYSGPWEKVAGKAREIGLTWGIRLKSGTLDRPHFQYEFDHTGTRRTLAYYRRAAGL
jgi:peptidoglycan L-alanyl-D-glutamate endopeptidase CwlK